MSKFTNEQLKKALFCPAQLSRDGRVDALVSVVVDLMMEVEALRDTVLSLSQKHQPGVAAKESAFGMAYREAAELTHCASGISSGVEKLIDRFYPRDTTCFEGARECVMLRRLGYTQADMDEYIKKAYWLETLT